METERQRMAPLTATESQLVYQWNLLFQTKSVPATKKKWGEEGATCSDLPSRHPLFQTQAHTCAFTRFSAHLARFYTGPPDSSSSIWKEAKAGAHQPHQHTSSSFVRPRHAAGRNSVPCQLLCGIFSSPIAHPAISEGIILWSMWHYRCMLFRRERLTSLLNVERNGNSVIIDISHWLVQL